LWERRKEMVGKWSRGMRQKLAVARALLHRPALIFLDEPTAGLDPVAAAALREQLDMLARSEGVTVFLTTHNLSEAEKLCGQVAVIRAGKLLAIGRPEELRSQARGQKAEIVGQEFSPNVLAAVRALPQVISAAVEGNRLVLQLQGGATVAPLVNAIITAGGQVEEVRKASLEDVFLNLVEEER
jgi:ABC-2 type transport system ATP-binding protein